MIAQKTAADCNYLENSNLAMKAPNDSGLIERQQLAGMTR